MAGIYSNLPYVTSKICLGNLIVLFRRHFAHFAKWSHNWARSNIILCYILIFFSHCVEIKYSGRTQVFAVIENIFIKVYESFACVGYVYASWSYQIFEESTRTNWTKDFMPCMSCKRQLEALGSAKRMKTSEILSRDYAWSSL